jgi:hypothetical protein
MGSLSSGHFIGVALVLVVFMLIAIFVFAIRILLEEKNKVKQMPRVPMTLCDVHGAYPSSSTLRLNVPADGKQDLVVEQCPQCYYDRYKSSKRIPE